MVVVEVVVGGAPTPYYMARCPAWCHLSDPLTLVRVSSGVATCKCPFYEYLDVYWLLAVMNVGRHNDGNMQPASVTDRTQLSKPLPDNH